MNNEREVTPDIVITIDNIDNELLVAIKQVEERKSSPNYNSNYDN
jgi:hypothetical protein